MKKKKVEEVKWEVKVDDETITCNERNCRRGEKVGPSSREVICPIVNKGNSIV